MASPSLKGLIDSYLNKSKLHKKPGIPKIQMKTGKVDFPSLKGNVNPPKPALKGLQMKKGPRAHRVRVKI